MILTLLFALLFGFFTVSRLGFERRLGRGSCEGFSLSYVEVLSLDSANIDRASTQPLHSLGNGASRCVDSWVTRLFIAIVLQCAALYLISQFPGVRSPFWLGVVLQGFTYGSAALFYASGGDEPTGY